MNKKFLVYILVICSFLSCNNQLKNKLQSNILISNLGSDNYKKFSYQTKSNENGMNFSNSLNFDNKYYAWYFDLGVVRLTPIWKSSIYHFTYKTDIDFYFRTITENVIENSLCKAEEAIYTHSYTGGFEVGVEASAGLEGIFGLKEDIKTDHHWTNSWERIKKTQESAKESYLERSEQGLNIHISFDEKNNFKLGKWYRVAEYSDVRTYGVLIYDIEKDKYSYTFLNTFNSDQTVTMIEEADDYSDFDTQIQESLDFDLNAAITFAQKNVPSSHGAEEESQSGSQELQSFILDANLLSCDLDNGYDYTKPSGNANNNHYSYNYDFGRFIIDNVASKIDDANYLLTNQDDGVVKFKVVYDCDNLPLQDNMTYRGVSNDDYNGQIYNLPGGNIGNQSVGKGILVAYITYEDGSLPKRIVLQNIFNSKKSGDEIIIVDGINKSCTINLSICFELTMWAPGFMGISDDYWMNYRINQQFNFIKN